MHTAVVSASGSTGSSSGLTSLLVLILVLLVAWPLFRRFRKSVSANRRQRWVEQGLMEPPPTDPPSEGSEGTDRSE